MASRKRRILFAIGLGVPFALALVLALFIRPEAGSLVAPIFGPWAGFAYGHSDCTMGNQMPKVAVGLVVLGLASLSALALVERRGFYVLTVTSAVVWAVGWELTALMSVLNTTS